MCRLLRWRACTRPACRPRISRDAYIALWMQGAVSIVETDMEVDFAPPVGYVEPDYKVRPPPPPPRAPLVVSEWHNAPCVWAG